MTFRISPSYVIGCDITVGNRALEIRDHSDHTPDYIKEIFLTNDANIIKIYLDSIDIELEILTNFHSTSNKLTIYLLRSPDSGVFISAVRNRNDNSPIAIAGGIDIYSQLIHLNKKTARTILNHLLKRYPDILIIYLYKAATSILEHKTYINIANTIINVIDDNKHNEDIINRYLYLTIGNGMWLTSSSNNIRNKVGYLLCKIARYFISRGYLHRFNKLKQYDIIYSGDICSQNIEFHNCSWDLFKFQLTIEYNKRETFDKIASLYEISYYEAYNEYLQKIKNTMSRFPRSTMYIISVYWW